MGHEFCPDCGHLLPKAGVQCMFCGWLDAFDRLVEKEFDPDNENDLIYTLADEAPQRQATML